MFLARFSKGDSGFPTLSGKVFFLMARVIAGSARGRKLLVPEGWSTRPTTDRNKEALFSMIQFDLQGTRFLDLFAGCGQIGIEALSRGASFCSFVESSRTACACIQGNLSALGMDSRSKVYPFEVEFLIPHLSGEQPFDIIYMDPPYGKGLEETAGRLVVQAGILQPSGFLIAESSSHTGIHIQGLELFKEKTYKTTRFSFFRQETS